MELLRAALVQHEVGENLEENLERAAAGVAEAARNGADIAVLPEMFCCLYMKKSFIKNKEPAGGRIWQRLRAMAADNHIYLVGGTMPELDGDNIYNTCFVFSPEGEQIARHRKVHLFDIDVPGGQRFFESDTFTPGDSVTVFDSPWGRIGVEICFDIRFQELARLTALEGAKLIIIPAAFNMTTGPAHWELHFRARAVDNQLFMLGCAPARDENGPYISYGNSIATDPWGRVVERLDEKPGILYADIDLSMVDAIRGQLPIMKNRRTDLYTLSYTE